MYETLQEKLAKEIEYLTKNPEDISDHWGAATPLFEFIPQVGYCLTQIALFPGEARIRTPCNNPKLRAFVDRIIEDDRIPENSDDITVEVLPVFAEYQIEAQEFATKEE